MASDLTLYDSTGNPQKLTGDNIKSGVGSMVTSGSNSNGRWVKYPDGTMMCYRINFYLEFKAGGYDRDSIWTFPVPFVDNFVVVTQNAESIFQPGGNADGPKETFMAIRNVDSTSCLVGVWTEGKYNNSQVEKDHSSVSVMAIGRWKK